MTIESSIAQIRASLDKVHQFEHIVQSETFQPSTITEMKSKAKDICDSIKSDVDNIKNEIDNWG